MKPAISKTGIGFFEMLQTVDPDAATYMIIAITKGLLTSSDLLEMDVYMAKKIWINAVRRLLLIE